MVNEQLRSWLEALRLRTLPLAISGILMGGFLSKFYHAIDYITTLLAFLTAILLQILSNLANDYGDFRKGADNEHRIGPERMTQSGRISPAKMRNSIILVSLLSLATGISLVFTAFSDFLSIQVLLFILAGLLAIAAAIKYTIGNNAFGYSGLGDLMVFIFFGIIAVGGTFYLNTQKLEILTLLPAASIGLLTVAVLNLNNMRDMVNDKNSGKKTVVVMMGMRWAKIYHSLLIILAFLMALAFIALQYSSYYQFMFLVCLPLFVKDLSRIFKNKEARELDPYLRSQAINTFIFALIFGLGLII